MKYYYHLNNHNCVCTLLKRSLDFVNEICLKTTDRQKNSIYNPHALLIYTLKQLNFSFSHSHTKDVQTIVIAPFKSVLPNIPITDSNVTIQIPVLLSVYQNLFLQDNC